jgi:hypothetical protein
MPTMADAAQLCGITAIVRCAIESAGNAAILRKPLAPALQSGYTAAFRGAADVRSGNQIETFSVYGTTRLGVRAERVLSPVVLTKVARGTINADIKKC